MAIQELKVLPQDKHIIERLFDSPLGLSIERIPGGETNRNHLVIEPGGFKSVVRIPQRDDVVDRGAERSNLEAILRSPVRWITPRYSTYVYGGIDILSGNGRRLDRVADGVARADFIEGEDLTLGALRDVAVRAELARSIATFHTSRVKLYPYDPFVNEIDRNRGRVVNSGIVISGVDAVERKHIEELTEVLRASLPVVDPTPSHNDLEFGNLRLSTGFFMYLLDPEYAGACNRGHVYDWGTLLAENDGLGMTMDILESVLELAEPTYRKKVDLRKVEEAALVNRIVTFWWGAVKCIEDQKKFEPYVRQRADRILSQNII